MKKTQKILLIIAIFIFAMALTGGGYVAYCYHDGMMDNPLNRAAESGDTNVAKLLFFFGADVNSVDDFDNTPLESAIRNHEREMVNLLIKHGANVNRSGYDGETPIFLAVCHGDSAMIELLVDSGAEINAINHSRRSPLDEAMEMTNNTAIVQTLQKNGAKTGFKIRQEKEFAAMSDDEKIFVSIANEDFTKCAELIVDNPELINAKTNSGENPLHWAAMTGNNEITNLFLSHGANVNAHDNWGLTPLHKAVIWGKKETAELLLRHGAIVNAKDSIDSWTPREWLRHIASGNAYPEIAMLLEEHGGK